jgi:glycosyltransferase involved in cell wall biosynthesis
MKEKGVQEYLEAADIIKDKNKDITFILAGSCDDPNLLNKIQKSHSRGTIHYIGHTKNIKSYINKTMVVVLPSYYFEGVPRILLEALALDKPIITTNWRGCRDTVVHNYNGRLIDIKNTNSLIESMNYFLEDSNLVSKMVGRSRKLAEEKFDRDKVNNKITENINKL